MSSFVVINFYCFFNHFIFYAVVGVPPCLCADEGKKGVRPSTHSVHQHGELLENTVVIQDIEKTLHLEFCCYGYRNITCELKDLGWIINHKKVYRLMKEHKLLYGDRIRPEPFKRNFIRYRTPDAERPLQYLSMDIKYVHIHGMEKECFSFNH